MPEDARLARLSREIFLSSFGAATAALEPWVVDRVSSLLEEGDAGAGSVLFAAGDPADYIYFMRDGKVELTKEGAAPWIYEGHWSIGTFDAVLEQQHTRTARVLADANMMKIRADAWLEVLEDSFELSLAIVMNSARMVAALEDKFRSMGGVIAAPASTRTRLSKGRLNLVERIAVLMDVPSLRGAGVQTLVDLAAVTDEVVFAPGETVLERKVARERAFLVIEGEVVASRESPDITTVYASGSLVCGAAAVGQPSLAWEATARSETRALAFRVADWTDLMEEHFDMVKSALAAYARTRIWLLEQMAAREGVLVMR